jgi:hypothetical protein
MTRDPAADLARERAIAGPAAVVTLRLRMTHCRSCGFHVGTDLQGQPITACECWPSGPDVYGPDPGCDWP